MDKHIVRFLLFLDSSKILVRRMGPSFDLPYHVLPPAKGGRWMQATESFATNFSSTSPWSTFWPVAELLGDKYDLHTPGQPQDKTPCKSSLLLLEHLEANHSINLPEDWEWIDETAFASIKHDADYDQGFPVVQERVLMVLHTLRKGLQPSWAPRFRKGWIRQVMTFANSILSCGDSVSDSHVVRLNHYSAVLRVDSHQHAHYIKASTFHELAKTRAVQAVMPECTPTVAISTDLDCLIVSGVLTFDKLLSHSDGLASSEMFGNMLVNFHRRSVPLTSHLISKGLPLMTVDVMLSELDHLAMDTSLKHEAPGLFQYMTRCLPDLRTRLIALRDYNFPDTLIHGDFCKRNAGLVSPEKKRIQMFDWEFSAVSHPLFDLHALDVRHDMCVIETYLAGWGEYETMERCKEAFNIAYPLGVFVKVVTLIRALKEERPEHDSMLIPAVMTQWNRMMFLARRFHFVPKTDVVCNSTTDDTSRHTETGLEFKI